MGRLKAGSKSQSGAGSGAHRAGGPRGKAAKKGVRERGLRDLINVGPATEGDLRLLGITRVDQLVKQDPLQMYARLCRLTGQRHDPCCIDVFMAVVASARGEGDRPWWEYTAARKALGARTPGGARKPRRARTALT